MAAHTSTQSLDTPLVSLWRKLPLFWAALFLAGLALNTLSVAASHPERLRGWPLAGLIALLAALLASYQRFTLGRVYGRETISRRRGLLLLAAQFALFALLTWLYDSSFAWFGLALLYQVVGGLPRRDWPLPLLGVFVLLVAGTSPDAARGTLDPGKAVTGFLLYASNFGIAITLGVMHEQRDRLRSALEQLSAANAALAAQAATEQELAVLRERSRLARAMHDDIGHALVVMSVKLEAAQLLYVRDRARGDAELEATRALIRSTMTSLRRALADLRSPAAASDDFAAALRQLGDDLRARAGVTVTCRLDEAEPAPPADVREALWYVAREALANIERHAGATSATLTFQAQLAGWRLRISDDGSGIAAADLREPDRFGVVGMRERMAQLGGDFSIRSGARGGSVVDAWAPRQVATEASAT